MKEAEKLHVVCPDCGNEFDVDLYETYVCACYNKPEMRYTENQKTAIFFGKTLHSKKVL